MCAEHPLTGGRAVMGAHWSWREGVRGWMRNEVGAGSILSLALVSSLVCVAGLLLPAAGLLVVHDRAQAVTDNAALAAADVLNGVVVGDVSHPCERVHDLLAGLHVNALDCRTVGGDVYVSASLSYGPLSFAVRSRAGAPDG